MFLGRARPVKQLLFAGPIFAEIREFCVSRFQYCRDNLEGNECMWANPNLIHVEQIYLVAKYTRIETTRKCYDAKLMYLTVPRDVTDLARICIRCFNIDFWTISSSRYIRVTTNRWLRAGGMGSGFLVMAHASNAFYLRVNVQFEISPNVKTGF